jgi:hypothetical protein
MPEALAAAPAHALSPLLPPALFAVPVAAVEAALARLPQLDMPVRHFFLPGLFARELTIPAGTLLTGRRYLVPHLFMVSAGQITVWGDGVAPAVLEAPFTAHGSPGTRRIGYAHRETVCTTILVHPSKERDPDKVLDMWTEIPPLPAELIGAPIPAGLRQLLLEEWSAAL